MDINSDSIRLGILGPNPFTMYFKNENYTPMAQVIVAFTIGILSSPWCSGLEFLIIFRSVQEILYWFFTQGDPRYYDVFTRAAVINASFLGYIIGRMASDDELLSCKFS